MERGQAPEARPSMPQPSVSSGTGLLPEAYGTRELVLSPRNPNWIYAHWDFTREQLQDYNSRAKGGHLSLRVFEESRSGEPREEIKVHPESRNWFLRVGTPGSQYKAELGYYSKEGGSWVSLSRSNVVTTPNWGLSEDTSAQFETLAADLPFAVLVRLARSTFSQSGPLPEIVQKAKNAGMKGGPHAAEEEPLSLTPEQESALRELVSLDEWRRTWMGSFEMVEGLKRKAVGEGLLPSELWSGGVSSPAPVGEKKAFWFNVNAELIVYGATEPEAQVTIGGAPSSCIRTARSASGLRYRTASTLCLWQPPRRMARSPAAPRCTSAGKPITRGK